MLIQNIIEENGLTVKENNQKKIHNIPIGTLVEIIYDDRCDGEEENPTFGCRLFVVAHHRDCDGTPLYELSFNKNAGNDRIMAEKDVKEAQRNAHRSSHDMYVFELVKMSLNLYKGSILSGYSEDTIKVVN